MGTSPVIGSCGVALLLLVSESSLAGPQYPKVKREAIAERVHGITFSDPFRWMENADDPDLAPWIAAQNRLAENSVPAGLLATLRGEFNQILGPSEAEDVETELMSKHVRRRFLERVRPFVSPEELGRAGAISRSPTGSYSTMSSSDSGSDFETLQILDATTNQLLPDVLFVKWPSILWEGDEGFLYTSDRDGRVQDSRPVIRRHRLKTKQADDVVVFESRSADVGLDLLKLSDRYLLIEQGWAETRLGTLDVVTGVVSPIISFSSGATFLIEQRGDELFFADYRNDPMGEVVKLDLATRRFTTIVPARTHALDQFITIGGRIYVTYVEEAESRLYRFDPSTRAFAGIALPGSGTAYVYESGGALAVYYSSYVERSSTWSLDDSTGALVQRGGNRTPPFAIEASKEFYTAHDGRQVPIWVIRKQGTPLTPDTPTYLYGYGGFRINILPWFQREALPWLARGGVVAVATLPGGLEYGEDWHKAGMLFAKRQVFDDFAAAARRLIERGLTSSPRLAISGASNGGLLVGATMNLYPTLFRAGVPEVGVMDMTRFQLFTAGKWWVPEYGNRGDGRAYRQLHSLSPYQNLKPGQFPATLVMTADADDRVVPAHSYKYAARLQQLQNASDSKLALLHVRQGGSHGWPSGRLAEVVNSRAVKWAFLMQELGLNP